MINVGVVEADADGLAVPHEYLLGRGDSRVCELRIRHSSLLQVQVLGPSHVLINFVSEFGRGSLSTDRLTLCPWLVREHAITKLHVEISSENFGSFYHLVYIDSSVSNV